MFSMCSELTPRARIPDTRLPQLMQPCEEQGRTGKYSNEKRKGCLISQNSRDSERDEKRRHREKGADKGNILTRERAKRGTVSGEKLSLAATMLTSRSQVTSPPPVTVIGISLSGQKTVISKFNWRALTCQLHNSIPSHGVGQW